MGKTFDQNLIDTARIPMSMIDPEDMEDTTSEEFISMREVQKGCHYELTNREDFPFNKYTKTIQTAKGQNVYSMPEGRVTKVIISDNNGKKELPYDSDIALYKDKEHKPEVYTISYNPNKIKLYPTPDKAYSVAVEYNSTKNVVLSNGQYAYEIEVGSTLRMPEQYQHLYFDALRYYVLYTNMRKVSNPRWQPTYEMFKQKWTTFLRGANAVESETVFTY